MPVKLVCTRPSHKYALGQEVLDPTEIAEIKAGDVSTFFRQVAMDAEDMAVLAAMTAPAAPAAEKPKASSN